MSGGSHGYVCYTIEEELCGKMHDTELNELIKDIADLAHDLEWWESADYCEEVYRETVRNFKQKWFNSSREQRLKAYVDKALEKQRVDLYDMIGVKLDDSVSAADVAPVVHGHWTTECCNIPTCSICGTYVSKDVYNSGDFTPRFCPHCGAKMDEEAHNGT